MTRQLLKRRPLLGEPSGWGEAVHPVLQRIYAARGVLTPEQAEHRLEHLVLDAFAVPVVLERNRGNAEDDEAEDDGQNAFGVR